MKRVFINYYGSATFLTTNLIQTFDILQYEIKYPSIDQIKFVEDKYLSTFS